MPNSNRIGAIRQIVIDKVMDRKLSFSGRLIIIGFGSIARASLPLFLHNSSISIKAVTVISPFIDEHQWFEQQGVVFVKMGLTEENYLATLKQYVEPGDFIVNLSVDVSSIDLIKYAKRAGALYLDTCIEPWAGNYDNPKLPTGQRTNYALRHAVLQLRKTTVKGPTAVVAHGANPGLISHLLKDGLVQLARKLDCHLPTTQGVIDWATLAMSMGVKVIQIAERDTQRSARPKNDNEFVNTWSVDGFLSEGLQPAELGWGTHEQVFPAEARWHNAGSKNAIYLERPGASVQVKTWTPLGGACKGLLITHHETISTADLLTIRKQGRALYRPTVYYAYHPCEDALLSIHELAGRGWHPQANKRILNQEIVQGGMDALGVLIMGHAMNAYWYGSLLSIDEARSIAPFNSATSLQVAAGVLSGVIWAIRHPDEGIVEAEQMDHEEILAISIPYLGSMIGIQTAWYPEQPYAGLFKTQYCSHLPWQFEHFVSG